jgi:hypothetical protein
MLHHTSGQRGIFFVRFVVMALASGLTPEMSEMSLFLDSSPTSTESLAWDASGDLLALSSAAKKRCVKRLKKKYIGSSCSKTVQIRKVERLYALLEYAATDLVSPKKKKYLASLIQVERDGGGKILCHYSIMMLFYYLNETEEVK